MILLRSMAGMSRHCLEAFLRGRQCAVEVGVAGMRDAADFLAGGRVEHGQRPAVGGVAPLAVDEELGVGVGHGLPALGWVAMAA